MRLIHTKGFNTSERKQWKVTIFNNLLHAFQVIFGAMEEQEVDFAHDHNIVSAIIPCIGWIYRLLMPLSALRGACCRRP